MLVHVVLHPESYLFVKPIKNQHVWLPQVPADPRLVAAWLGHQEARLRKVAKTKFPLCFATCLTKNIKRNTVFPIILDSGLKWGPIEHQCGGEVAGTGPWAPKIFGVDKPNFGTVSVLMIGFRFFRFGHLFRIF